MVLTRCAQLRGPFSPVPASVARRGDSGRLEGHGKWGASARIVVLKRRGML